MKKLEEHALMAEENSTLSGGFCSTGAVNLKSLLRKMVLVFFFLAFIFFTTNNKDLITGTHLKRR